MSGEEWDTREWLIFNDALNDGHWDGDWHRWLDIARRSGRSLNAAIPIAYTRTEAPVRAPTGSRTDTRGDPEMTKAKTFRKKTVEIQAIQFLGVGESCTAVTEFLGGPAAGGHRWKTRTYEGGWIITLEGEMEFVPGDWIIKGVAGEFYPCKPWIFEASYDEVPA